MIVRDFKEIARVRIKKKSIFPLSLFFYFYLRGLPLCGEIDVSRALAGYSNVGVLTGLFSSPFQFPFFTMKKRKRMEERERKEKKYHDIRVIVAILFIVAKGIEISSVLKYFIKYVLRKPASLLDAQVQIFSLFSLSLLSLASRSSLCFFK